MAFDEQGLLDVVVPTGAGLTEILEEAREAFTATSGRILDVESAGAILESLVSAGPLDGLGHRLDDDPSDVDEGEMALMNAFDEGVMGGWIGEDDPSLADTRIDLGQQEATVGDADGGQKSPDAEGRRKVDKVHGRGAPFLVDAKGGFDRLGLLLRLLGERRRRRRRPPGGRGRANDRGLGRALRRRRR